MSRRYFVFGSYSSAVPLLLDTYPATAAFSFQKIRTAYAGNACQVRRASDNALQEFGFVGTAFDVAGLQSWLAGADGYIRRMNDQQNANNATQTNNTLQPKIATAGVVELLNGEPCMVFSGTQYLTIPSTVYVNQGSASVFCMANFETANNYEMLYTHSDGLGVLGRIEIRRSTTNNYLEWMCFSNAGATAGTTPITNLQNLYSVIGSRSSTTNAYVDGTLDATFATPVNLLGNYVSQWGARNGGLGFVGRSQELVLYRTNESANRTGIETNILGRY